MGCPRSAHTQTDVDVKLEHSRKTTIQGQPLTTSKTARFTPCVYVKWSRIHPDQLENINCTVIDTYTHRHRCQARVYSKKPWFQANPLRPQSRDMAQVVICEVVLELSRDKTTNDQHTHRSRLMSCLTALAKTAYQGLPLARWRP